MDKRQNNQAREFILANSPYYRNAVEQGYDIRMGEEELLFWMQKYKDESVKTNNASEDAGEYLLDDNLFIF